MKSRPTNRITVKNPKLSPEARKIINAALKKNGYNVRATARALKLCNHAELDRMIKGRSKETPAMRLAVARARRRAERAFLMDLKDMKPVVDRDVVRRSLHEVIRKLEALDCLLRGDDSHEARGV